jgi:predicted secreted protein
MSLISALAIYFVIWWLVLFAVLPFGVRSQHEAGDVTLGTDHGAPERPRLAQKFAITTAIAAIVFVAVYIAFGIYMFSLEDMIR